MSDYPKSETNILDKDKKESKIQKQKASYGKWLFRKEGTAAEPWPTADDLWNDPAIKNAVKVHNAEVQKRNGSSK